ncbi:MAG: hypothetical protein ACI9FB_002969, partial [Candidatus Azotimanducaceae bacterium]
TRAYWVMISLSLRGVVNIGHIPIEICPIDHIIYQKI